MNNFESLFADLSTSSAITVLTPNRRLSASLQRHYQQYRQNLGDTCWNTPDILPISTWIERLWADVSQQEIALAPLILSTAQESFIWEKILLKTKASQQLLQVSETAELVKTAWGLLKQWQVDLNLAAFTSAEDYAALHEWIHEFQDRCHKNNWLAHAAIPDLIMQKNFQPVERIVLFGFTEINPQLTTLFNICKTKNCAVQPFKITRDVLDCQRTSLPDLETEIITMARWAKALHDQHPNLNIGCVIPTLDKTRDRVLQIFSGVFTSIDAFNISAGKNLAHYPIINTALQLLGLYKKKITQTTFSEILASPFTTYAEQERLRRYKFEAKLRQDNITQIDLCKLIEINTPFNKSCPRLAAGIQAFLNYLEEFKGEHDYHTWATMFSNALAQLGWPGERSLSSVEYQVVENWLKVLMEFSTLDQISKPVTYEQAFHTLQKMVAKSVFQPQSPQAPIQVLGVLEAAAIPFDYLWVAGMDDMTWPPQPKPNPFIPKALQRELHMPHATAERELLFCEIMLQQFKHGAAHVIFSHAENNDDLELQASPLIRNLPILKLENLQLADYTPATEKIHANKVIDIIFDAKGPSVHESEKIRGGVSVLKQQALCPFKAYAEWRLHAREIEQPLPGLRAKDRGEIIHKILELLWNRLQEHAGLLALNEASLTEYINTAINETFQLSTNSRNDYPHYIGLEKQRLFKLVYDWLQIEKSRPAFKIANNEKISQINIGPLTLNVRIDRIDELADGTKMIIDYKTGKNNDINHWFTDRPEEPQLPLYSLLDPENTTAISFAQIAQGETCFKGISRHDMDIKGVKLIPEVKKAGGISWEEQLNKWQSILTQLSHDFHAGIATVDPKDPAQTCEWCALQPLCRINEDA